MNTSCASPSFLWARREGVSAICVATLYFDPWNGRAGSTPPTHPGRRAVSAAPPRPTPFRDGSPRFGALAPAGAGLACVAPVPSVPRNPVSAASGFGTAKLAPALSRAMQQQDDETLSDQLQFWE